MTTLKDLLPSNVIEHRGDLQQSVARIAFDSRHVTPGTLFVALPGANVDGSRFAADAVAKGAIAVLTQDPLPELGVPVIRAADSRRALSEVADRFFAGVSRQLSLVGITGTKGKTTTAFLVQAVMQQAFGKAFRLGTVEHDLGIRIQPARNTTPESLEIMEFLNEAFAGGVSRGVMEVSSHALKSFRVEHVTFAAAGFANLSLEHTEFHPNMEDYYRAKRRLFLELLPATAPVAVGIDDEWGRRLAAECRDAGRSVRTVSVLQPSADFFAAAVEGGSRETAFHIVAEGGTFPCRLQFPGIFNVFNALMAAALCRGLGIEWPAVTAGISRLARVPGRLEPVPNHRDLSVIVDYAHSPASLENVLRAVRPLTQKRLITVFGCGGNRSREKRPVMGKLAAELADVTIVTSDNPRKEQPEAIIAEIMAGIDPASATCRSQVKVEPDRRRAIGMAISMAQPGDIVLIAGKGHETGQTFADRTLPFDDREVAREFLLEVAVHG
jgi:UDP-N-acetylmuramoyl-L-alanyl-D-glutamate--2,6-diaminopimelate ligase